MKAMDIKLAWRNIWRNRRRSAIIILAIAVGLAGVIVYEAFMVGMAVQMVENIVGTSLGDLQVHRRGFRESRALELTIDDPKLLQVVQETEHVAAAAPRVRAQGLISSARAAARVEILGIDPTAEPAVSTVARSLVRGRFLAAGDERAIYLGEALAKKLKIALGRKVVLLAQGLAPEMGSDAFHLVGTFKTASPDFDKVTVYIPLAAAQELLSLDGKISEIVVRVDQQRNLEQVDAALGAKLDPNIYYEVLTWKELAPDLVQMKQLWEGMLYLFAVVIYIAMVFGVTNTMLMAVAERTRELGVMLALGTRPGRIFRLILLETTLMGLVGVALGGAASLGLTWWLALRGLDLGWFVRGLEFMNLGRIIYPVLTPSVLLISGSSALVAAVLAALWPAWRAVRLEPVEALRYV